MLQQPALGIPLREGGGCAWFWHRRGSQCHVISSTSDGSKLCPGWTRFGFRGFSGRRKFCLPSGFCEEPAQCWHCLPSDCSMPTPLLHPMCPLQHSPDFSQRPKTGGCLGFHLLSESPDLLPCSAGNSSQLLNRSSHQPGFQKCQPEAAPAHRERGRGRTTEPFSPS